jgi:protease I
MMIVGCGQQHGPCNCGKKHAAKSLGGMEIAMLTGEGFQSQEAMMPLAFLTNRGAHVTVIGTEIGKVKAYDNDVHLVIEKTADQADPDEYDALIIPGGHAPAKIRKNTHVVKFAETFYNSGKPVAAICHGPQVLITAGVVKDQDMTCYSGVKKELTKAGAKYHNKAVVRDDNLITSRLPKDIPGWLAATEKMLMTRRAED